MCPKESDTENGRTMNIDPIDILSLPFHDETEFPDYGQMMIHRETGDIVVSHRNNGYLSNCNYCFMSNSPYNWQKCMEINYARCVIMARFLELTT